MSKFKFKQKAEMFNRLIYPMAKRIGEFAVAHTKNDVFPSESWDGNSWKRKKNPDGKPLLVKTGAMKKSIRVLQVNRDIVKWGTTVDYAGYHNEGTNKLPKRKFIGIDKGIFNFIKDRSNDLFKRVMK